MASMILIFVSKTNVSISLGLKTFKVSKRSLEVVGSNVKENNLRKFTYFSPDCYETKKIRILYPTASSQNTIFTLNVCMYYYRLGLLFTILEYLFTNNKYPNCTRSIVSIQQIVKSQLILTLFQVNHLNHSIFLYYVLVFVKLYTYIM